ncbi:MFS transporter [Stackebrandtia endophytica]|uniref:MFS transporter n=1 Tax=Stackebrandtia endophytica TaxID=1496996 RepID=A0A543B2L8_9ACTN|nr:MFS transporter [Stackebrandtia endophytica]TQL79068.1 MFS transporter [Stackebrandtia endophytica]
MLPVSPSTLRSRYVVITALTWLPQGISMAAMLLLMADRGMDLVTIGILFTLQSIVVTALELPTGGFSDVIGRRGVLVVSALVGLAGFAWMAFAHQVWEFVAVAVLRGIARALSTGPAEAWYVDAVHADDPAGDIRTGLAFGQTATGIALGVGTLVGGSMPFILPTIGPLEPLATPMALSALLYLGLLASVLTGMTEPARRGPTPTVGALMRDVPATIGAGVKLGFGRRALAQLLMTFAVLGFALNAVELLTPGWLEVLVGDAESAAAVYGMVTALGFVASAVGSLLTPLVARMFGGNAHLTAMVGTVFAGAGMASMFISGYLAASEGVIVIAIGYGLLFLGLGVRGPVQSELVHHEVAANQRATVVSIQSLLMQASGAVSSLTIPWLVAVWSVPGTWLLSGVALAASAVLFKRPSPQPRPVTV